jgi:AraC family transcriptional regulator
VSHHEARILPVLVHIEDHLDEPLRLDALAALAGFSPHHFHRVFRAVTGEPPAEYVRRLRLERAVLQLKVSPDSVLQIALDAGFRTHETFTRAFTRRFDIHPSEFRRVLRAFRDAVSDDMATATFDGYTDDTPLTLRFAMERQQVTVARTPARHLLFVRHHGYETLLADGRPLVSLWDELIAMADARGIRYSPDLLVALTHDDPFVTDDERIRFDACIVVDGPIEVPHPFAYRTLDEQVCVVRRHSGGLEEIARTFAFIGVEWLVADDHRLRATAPFETYRCTRTDGRLDILHADAHVPLHPRRRP